MLSLRRRGLVLALCLASTTGQYCCLPCYEQVCQAGCTIYPGPHGANGADACQAYCASHCGIPKAGDGTSYTPAEAIAHNQQYSSCDFSTQYQSSPATPTAFAVCSALTVCSAGEYESVPPTHETNRQCNQVTQCVVGVNY
jgi:hypothetical protein